LKFLATTLLLTALMLAGPAFAQIDPDLDGIGIYYDLDGYEHCHYQVPPGTQLELYLLLTNPSSVAGVSGWECRIEPSYSAMNLVVNWHAVGYWGGFWDPPNFQIGLATPLPWAPAVHLLTITSLILDPACWWFYIVPHPTPTIPGQIIYVDGVDPGIIIPMYQSTGGPENPVAGVNCSCIPPPLPTEQASWGSVKSLYR